MANPHTVLVPSNIAAMSVDSFVKNFISATQDIDNGGIFMMGDLSTDSDKREVFTAIPVDVAADGEIYMAFTAEDSVVEDGMGNKYKLGLLNPQNFTNVKGMVFSGYAPKLGDEIWMTVTPANGTLGNNKYLNAANGYSLVFGATAGDKLSYKLVEKRDMSIATGNINTQRVAAYRWICVSV